MLEKNEINGRPCVVVYLDNHFKPVDSQDEAELVRVVFTDEEGGAMYLVPKDYLSLNTESKGVSYE